MGLKQTVRTRISDRGKTKFKKGYQPTTNLMKDENGELFTVSTIPWIDGSITYVSYWMYMTLILLGWQKCI